MADNTHDLTKGKISNHLIRLTLPLIAGNIIQQFYGTIDALVIGRFASEKEFASIGVASSVMNLFMFAIIGGCVGISVIFAQLYGKNDMDSFRKEHFLVFTTGIALTSVMSAIGIIFIYPLLCLIKTPAVIADFTFDYLKAALISLPASYIYNLYAAVFRSVGRSSPALIILTAATIVNLGLDLLFIGYFGFGVRGAAYGTVIAQIISALLCIVYMKIAMPSLMFTKSDFVIDNSLLKKTLRFSFITGLQQTGLYIGKLLVQGAVNTGGISMIAAYTATTRIEGFINAFGDSGAAALSVMTAQSAGSEDAKRIRQIFKTGMILLCFFGLISSAVLFFSTSVTVELMLGKSGGFAYDNACDYMHIIALFYILNFTGSVFAGHFDGCGRVNTTLAGTVGQITFRVVLSWLIVGTHGLPSLALITGSGWLLLNVCWAVCYRCSILAATQKACGN